MNNREKLDYTLLPDELWSIIFIQAIDLHDHIDCPHEYPRGCKNCGLTRIEQTCRHFRHIVVKNCLWKDACLENCKKLEDVIRDGDAQELWNGARQYRFQRWKRESAEEQLQNRKSLLFKRLYGLLIAEIYQGKLIKDILWTSEISDGYDPSIDYNQYLWEKWCDTRNHLTGYQPKKDQVGGQSDEAVARILVQLHYPTAIVRSLDIELYGHKHKAVHIRLYRGLPNGSRQAVNLNLPRADCQEHFANLDKSVQDFFSSPREVVCDKILKPGLAVVETEGFLCNDGALMMELYVKDKDLASEDTQKMEMITMNIRGNIVPGMKISDKGVLSSIAYDDDEVKNIVNHTMKSYSEDDLDQWDQGEAGDEWDYLTELAHDPEWYDILGI